MLTSVPDDPVLRSEPLLHWLESRVDELAAEATHAIFDEIPGYAAAYDVAFAADVREHCRHIYVTFIECVRDGRVPERTDYPATETHAVRRSERGIGVAEFMQAFRVGQLVIWEQIQRAVVAHPHARDGAMDLVSALMRVIEIGSEVGAETWLLAEQHRLAHDAKWRRDLLEELLAGRAPESTQGRAALAGLGLSGGGFAVLAARPTDAEPDDTALAQLERLLGGFTGLVATRRAELVGVLSLRDLSVDAICAQLRPAVDALAARGVRFVVGVSDGWESLAEAGAAYREAQLARDGLLAGHGVLPITEIPLAEHLVLARPDSAERLVRGRLRAFIEEDLAAGGALVDTLKAYVASELNAKEAASRLHVHVNTVYYRLDRFSERSGGDVHLVSHLIESLLAIRVIETQLHRDRVRAAR